MKAMDLNTIYNIGCLEGLKTLPDNSIDCCVTSPPYFGLRDYGHQNQIGLEENPDAFVGKLVQVFEEVRRVLKAEGTLWLNLGDTYAGYYGEKYGQAQSLSGSRENKGNAPPNKVSMNFKRAAATSTLQGGKDSQINSLRAHENVSTPGLKPKDLIGIPWMVAFALRANGWFLRQDIIWHKPNPMPESVIDRCTKSHEYIFLLSKSSRYYFDQESILQPIKLGTIQRLNQPGREYHADGSRVPGKINGNLKAISRSSGNKNRKLGAERGCPERTGSNVCGSVPWEGEKANKKSVWIVSTKPFKDAHFATFPQDLIIDCIKAGCPENGIVLDPFMGAGTTAVVAAKTGRKYIGFELNEEYIRIANKRIQKELGLFNMIA